MDERQLGDGPALITNYQASAKEGAFVIDSIDFTIATSTKPTVVMPQDGVWVYVLRRHTGKCTPPANGTPFQTSGVRRKRND